MNIPFLTNNINKKMIKKLNKLKSKLNSKTHELIEGLKNGNFLNFEQQLHEVCTEFYVEVAKLLIVEAMESKKLKDITKIIAQKKGLSTIEMKNVTIQLVTGHYITVPSWYAKRSRSKRKKGHRGPNGSGCHLILEYFGFIKKASPGYYSYVLMLSLICPSFNCVVQVAEHQNIRCEYKRIRDLCYTVADKCFDDRVKIALQPGESVIGKRVIVSTDGGRTRIRQQKKGEDIKDENRYDTPWREPKLFVINILNDDGTTSKTELPIYDCTMGKADACFDLLKAYLSEIEIQKAKEVIFIADGAPWIWERARPMLLELGVAPDQMTEAIDFYHAVERISAIINEVKGLSVKDKKAIFYNLRAALKNGKLNAVIDKLLQLTSNNEELVKKIKYFRRNALRLRYDLLTKKSLPLGSGIVESSIRRIINLRFKSPSTFWKIKNVEKLIFLRGILLAGRWSIMINNLVNPEKFIKIDKILKPEVCFDYQ